MKRAFTVYASMDFKQGVLTIEDGSTNSVEVKFGEGNLTWSEKKPRIYDKDRGKLAGVRNADEEPLEVNFSFRWETLKGMDGDEAPTVYEALKAMGLAASWTSTDADPCNPYCVNLIFTFTPGCSDLDIEEITFPDFRYETLDPDAKGAIVAVRGMCNVLEPTIVRTAQE